VLACSLPGTGTYGFLPWNKRVKNSARLRHQTIHVWAPGVSMSVCSIPFGIIARRGIDVEIAVISDGP